MIRFKPITGVGLGFEFLDTATYNEIIDRNASSLDDASHVKFVMTIDIIILRIIVIL